MEKVYVVVIDNCYDFINDIFVAVFRDKAKAREYMLEQFKYEIGDNNFNEIEYGDNVCSAYDEGYFAENHCEIRLLEESIRK